MERTYINEVQKEIDSTVKVQGFIENCGKNYRLCGCWKVYGDPQAALRCFARYEKCARVYLQCYQNGHSLSRLTVAG